MRMFTRTALVSALALGLATPATAQFSSTYIFGDSLADAGQFGSRLTTNPGLTAPMYVGQNYGFTATPSLLGGTDYAIAGARVNTLNPSLPSALPYQTVVQQVSAFLAKGPLDGNALYQINGGGNDLLALAPAALAGQITAAQLQGGIVQAATDLVTQIARLQAAGARYIVVQGFPDAGKSPYASTPALAGQLTALSDLFNSTLNARISAAGLQVIPVNYGGLQREVIANPAAYGFTNAKEVVCTTSSSLACGPGTLKDPQGANTWVFADDVHPTTGFHKLVAAATLATIAAPQQIAMLAEAPLAVEQASWRALDGRMLSGTNAPRPAGKLEFWAAYDYANPDMESGFRSGDAKLNTLSVGGDIRLSEHLLAGASADFTENKGDFGSGGYKLNQTSATVYVGYGKGPWYVGATVGAADLDYSDVHRNLTLGALSRTESGETRGTAMVGRLLGGYWFNAGNWIHGPTAKYTYQEIKVRSFQEQGANSTTMSFDQQKRKSSLLSVGWQASGSIANVRPFARITWENELDNDERSVGAGVYGMAGRFSVPAFRPDDNWVQMSVGAAADFGRVTGYISASGTASKADGDGYAITVGLRIPL